MSVGRPRCSPIRTRTCASSGQRGRVHRPLDGERRLDRSGRLLEDREQLVRPRVHLAAAGAANSGPDEPADVGQDPGVAIAQPLHQLGRSLDIGQEQGDVAMRQPALRLQLGADESDRNDAVLLGRPQQAHPGAIAGGVVLERHLAEAGKRVSHMRSIVDGQAPAPVRRDVGERAVGELRPRLGTQRRHLGMIAEQARCVLGRRPRAW